MMTADAVIRIKENKKRGVTRAPDHSHLGLLVQFSVPGLEFSQYLFITDFNSLGLGLLDHQLLPDSSLDCILIPFGLFLPVGSCSLSICHLFLCHNLFHLLSILFNSLLPLYIIHLGVRMFNNINSLQVSTNILKSLEFLNPKLHLLLFRMTLSQTQGEK